MKKIIYILFVIFLLVGCSKTISLEYYEKLDELKEVNNFSLEYPYDIEVLLEDLDQEEYIYQVVIDNPKENFNDFKVLVYHDIKTNDIFPSYGFDNEKTLDFKGINLVGYINKTSVEENIDFKIMVIVNGNSYYHNFIK